MYINFEIKPIPTFPEFQETIWEQTSIAYKFIANWEFIDYNFKCKVKKPSNSIFYSTKIEISKWHELCIVVYDLGYIKKVDDFRDIIIILEDRL